MDKFLDQKSIIWEKKFGIYFWTSLAAIFLSCNYIFLSHIRCVSDKIKKFSEKWKPNGLLIIEFVESQIQKQYEVEE